VQVILRSPGESRDPIADFSGALAVVDLWAPCFLWLRERDRRFSSARNGRPLLSFPCETPHNQRKGMVNNIDLEGRNAVVTGGAQGFGKAISERFAASGARIAIWDQDIGRAKATAGALGKRAVAIPCDVAEPAAVAKACDATVEALGRIDILINNAGIAGANAKTWETDVEEWRRVMRINLDGPFLCSRAVVPLMIAQNYGRIVNIASIAGKEGNPNAAHYSASKAGVIALTKSLGKELAGYDIAVNAVTPAAAKTAIFDQITQEHIDFMLSKIPRNRFVTVEEVAALVAWLASAENSFTTSAVFDISGGRATY
jgi:NAD(P)-dependent dehydrogenase (short-subunit alcohol dehydrogenase family)